MRDVVRSVSRLSWPSAFVVAFVVAVIGFVVWQLAVPLCLGAGVLFGMRERDRRAAERAPSPPEVVREYIVLVDRSTGAFVRVPVDEVGTLDPSWQRALPSGSEP